MNPKFTTDWLPASAKEVQSRGWDQLDIILFTGDAYVDHPSFGTAVIGRILEAAGYRVGIVPQPNWRDDHRDFKKLGRPRLFFGVSAGNMDSMVNRYTANLRLRSDDAYTPGNQAGFRPDYAVTVYTRILKELYPEVPVVLGGIEASLRRLTHYDYWSDTIKPSVLIDSGADLLSYGMGDIGMVEIARAMHNGFNLKLLRNLPQVAFIADAAYAARISDGACRLHVYEECVRDPLKFAENFVRIETQSNRLEPQTLIEGYGDRTVVVNPPYPPMTEKQLDRTYALPFTRLPHPRYRGKGAIPAYEMIKFSVNLHRGCFGGCSFCTISAHQGKFISSRSPQSVLREVEALTRMDNFKGVLTDLGGPSANMYRMSGMNRELCRNCVRPSCIDPKPCKNLRCDHAPLIDLYRKVRSIKGVKRAFIGSGIRYDLFMRQADRFYLREVIRHHVSGRLKVAPEHTEESVLRLMRKPSFEWYRQLQESFREICEEEGVNYQLVPYFISSHPGCTEDHMKWLARETRRLNIRLEPVQDFTPTPMTLSSVMFATGIDPYTGQPLYVARAQDEKRRQKSYFFSPGTPPRPVSGSKIRRKPRKK
ncbi:MAG: YgiQ family radical SAM protein [Rikenellaceae bacterium]|nr:YgiQ family radical SAM protein [Rikenellaceae bacterium]